MMEMVYELLVNYLGKLIDVILDLVWCEEFFGYFEGFNFDVIFYMVLWEFWIFEEMIVNYGVEVICNKIVVVDLFE